MNNNLTDFAGLYQKFESQFEGKHFPEKPKNLYRAAEHYLSLRAKRIRPVLCLMGNELFGPLKQDAYYAANALELFHNFTLVHDDMMDHASVRRGHQTVHKLYGESTALLAGDVMLVQAYEYLGKIDSNYLSKVIELFSETARKVCEGQQLDMEFESRTQVSLDEYVNMISLKTSVLLAASLKIGSILGGAGLGNQENLYEFGKNLGIAFQIQDDYLDAFGDAEKFGKKHGGDILANKKTFLHLHAMNVLEDGKKAEYAELMHVNGENKIEPIIDIYRACGVDDWAKKLKQKYFEIAMNHLEEVAVVSARKHSLIHLAESLMERNF